MTMEPMPKGAPQTRVDPVTGKPFRLMHINFEPLPDDMAPAERAIIEANRSAMRAEARANWDDFMERAEANGYEGAKDGWWPWFARELKYGFRFGYRVYKALGGRY